MVLCITKSSETMMLNFNYLRRFDMRNGIKIKYIFTFPTIKLNTKSEYTLTIRHYISVRFNQKNIILLVYAYMNVPIAIKYLFLPWWLLNIIQGTFSGGLVSANIPLFIYPADNMCILSQQSAKNIHTASAAAEEAGCRKKTYCINRITPCMFGSRMWLHYRLRYIIARSHKVSKLGDPYLKVFNYSGICRGHSIIEHLILNPAGSKLSEYFEISVSLKIREYVLLHHGMVMLTTRGASDEHWI